MLNSVEGKVLHHDEDQSSSLPSMVNVPLGGTDDNYHAEATKTRDSFEQRRRRNHHRSHEEKHHRSHHHNHRDVEDGRSCGENTTLTNLQNSISTSGGDFLRELIETTARYDSSPGNHTHWQLKFKYLMQKCRFRLFIKKYATFLVLLFVLVTVKVLWRPSYIVTTTATTSTYSDTEAMTINSFLAQELQRIQQQHGLSNADVNTASYHMNSENHSSIVSDAAAERHQEITLQSENQQKLSTAKKPPHSMEEALKVEDDMALPDTSKQKEDHESLPLETESTHSDYVLTKEYRDRVQRLREISARGRAAVGHQQANAQQPETPQPETPRPETPQTETHSTKDGTSEITKPPTDSLEESSNDRNEKQTTDQGKVEPDEFEAPNWKPRKRGENKVVPSNLVTSGLG